METKQLKDKVNCICNKFLFAACLIDYKPDTNVVVVVEVEVEMCFDMWGESQVKRLPK